MNAVEGIPCAKLRDRIAWYRRKRRAFDQRSTVWPPEIELAGRLSFYLKAFFVNCAVVLATEQREIRQPCGTAVRPMTDVVALAKRPATAGEATAPIAMLKRAP